MENIEEIKQRIKDRSHNKEKVLTDNHFSKLYNGMIKLMVVIIVGLSVGAYIKVSPNADAINQTVFNNELYKNMNVWIMNNFNRLTQDYDVTVSKDIFYNHIEDNYYTNMSNEALNFDKGRVIYIGYQQLLGNYVTILLDSGVEVTYGNLNDLFIDVYDHVESGTILGTYDEKILIVFKKGLEEITYHEFENIEN